MGEAPTVVVSGYASIDEVYKSSRLAGAAQTGVLSGPVRPVPRHGGCGPNTARVLANLGVPSAVITWVGDDAEGRAFVEALAKAGVSLAGVEVGRGASPRCLLLYDATGDAACYFHPSGSAKQSISPLIRQLVANARWLAITVGPAEVSAALLDARGPSTRLAWGVKGDALAFPPELCARLVQADVICLNRHELEFVADALSISPSVEALLERGAGAVVLTRGAQGYSVVTPDGSSDGHVEPVSVPDLTGAGDAFLAGLLEGLVGGEDTVVAAARGARVARSYLLNKSQSEVIE
jgi:ribokinase